MSRIMCLLLTPALLWPGAAAAFQCSPAGTDPAAPSQAWSTRAIPFTLHAGGTADIPGDEELDALRAAFATWEGAQECAAPQRSTNITFEETPTTTVDRVGYNWLSPSDNENLVIFRDTGWLHHPSVLVMATVVFNAVTGELLDADIELNSQHFDFTISDTAVGVDLISVALGAIGQALGFGSSSDTTSVMYPTYAAGTLRRDLACDDRNGVVFRYPAGEDLGSCAPGKVDASCGFCAPSGTLTTTLTFTVLSSRDGITPCP